MDLQAQLQYCKICQNRTLDVNIGLVCGLTQAKPTFENNCVDFKPDEEEANRLIAREKAIEAEENEGGLFGPEKAGIQKGVTGGLIMIVIAIVWFFGGLAAGYLFYYPPILLVLGLYALVKGLIKRNYSGEKAG
ncbi:MAG: hypothetical protein AAGA85_17530 [Bacteroidota bacterium]